MAVSKDARKKAALKRSAARSTGRTRATLMTPGKIVESGLGGYAVAKVAQAAVKSASKKTGTRLTKKVPKKKTPPAAKPKRVPCATCGRTNIVKDSSKRIVKCRGKGCGYFSRVPR